MLTNDGELAELLTHPRHGVEKAYLAEVEGVPSAGAVRRLREGVDARRRTGAGRARPRSCSRPAAASALEIVLKEGRKRIVRRMCSAIGHPVRRLVRTRIGPLADPKLAPGIAPARSHRAEVRALYAAALEGARIRSRLTSRAREGPGSARRDHLRREQQTRGRRQDAALVRRCSSATRSTHDDIVSIIFTATDDITAEFPATAARALGLGDVPLLCARELGDRARHAARASACSCTSTASSRVPSCTTCTSKARARSATTFPPDRGRTGRRRRYRS